MPNWKKLIVSGSDASLNSLNVTNNVTAQSFTGSFSGSFTAPGATTQVVFNSGGSLAASSNFVFSGSRVGIGTTTPQTALDVNGIIRVAGNGSGYLEGYRTIWETADTHRNIGSGGYQIENVSGQGLTFGYANNQFAVLDTSGNFGIGTTSPSYKLQVVGDGAGLYVMGANSSPYTQTIATFVYGGNSNSINIENQGGKASIQARAGASVMDLHLNPVGGNVGIGTTSPSATLEVNGNVKAVSFTGSLSGSATNAVSSSYALTSSYASFAQTAGAASTATSASYALSASYATSTSYAVTSSYALTASYVNPLNQDLIVTGSVIATSLTASNALITGNLSVLGTASFVYTTASVVTIGGNLITLNTDNPSVRFAGITVVDSGSFGNSSTGSLFWDSQNNRWIYSNPSGSSYDGGMFISGPRNTSGLGNEQGTTLNAILKGQGGDHLTSSGMFEDSSGNVGVGTASPSAKFEVIGNVKATSFTGSFSGSVSAPGSTTQIVYNSGGALAADSGLVYSGSNVGIGISSPTEKLHIVSSATGNQFGRITATDSTASAAWVAQNDQGDNVVYRVFGSGVSGTQMGNALGRSASLLANLGGSGVFLLGTYSNTDFILGTNNTENMRIKSGGNVGIGTSSPSSLLNVVAAGSNSSALVVEDDARKVKIGRDQIQVTDLSDAASTMYLQPNSNLVINSTAGNVGIGTQPSQKLEVQGSAQIGNDSVTSAGLFFARKNSNQAKSHYFLSAQESPTYQWIEGGYFTSELAGVSVANNSGKPYYESYAPAGQAKSFGFINQTTSGSSFTSTAVTASVILYQGGNIALAPTLGDVGIGTTSPNYKLTVYEPDTAESVSARFETTHPNLNYILLKNGGGSYNHYLQTNSNSLALSADENGSSGIIYLKTNNTTALTVNSSQNVGIGTTSPGYKLEVVGAVSASTYYGDGSNLTNIGSGSVSAAGSDGQLQYNNGGSFGGATRLYYNDTTNRVGIGTSSPGYDLDVSGSTRVQDRLRVGVVNTGNGVIHQSSDATINPSGATIVWSVPGSAGICAFIEYYVFNSNTGTSQRAGNIVTTWNASGTPQITHTETSTPDIGSTSPITFSTSLTLGGDPQLIATNSGGDIWYMIMNYRYF
jgi:hypothetical protein